MADQSASSDPLTSFGPNEWLVDELYEQYLKDKNSVDRAWWDFFKDYEPGEAALGHGPAAAWRRAAAAAPPAAAAPAPAAPSANGSPNGAPGALTAPSARTTYEQGHDAHLDVRPPGDPRRAVG